MSWTGTVRCGYCYNEGHNKRGCPKRKARAAEDIANGHPTYAARVEKDYRAAAKNRCCSYCIQSGHNATTCPRVKSDWSRLSKADTLWRKNIINHYKTSHPGLGLGALILQTRLPHLATAAARVPITYLLRLAQCSTSESLDKVLLDTYGLRQILKATVISATPAVDLTSRYFPEVLPEILNELEGLQGKLIDVHLQNLSGLHPHYHELPRDPRQPRSSIEDPTKYGNIQVLTPASAAAVDYMWQPFREYNYTIDSLRPNGKDRNYSRRRLREVVSSLERGVD